MTEILDRIQIVRFMFSAEDGNPDCHVVFVRHKKSKKIVFLCIGDVKIEIVRKSCFFAFSL